MVIWCWYSGLKEIRLKLVGGNHRLTSEWGLELDCSMLDANVGTHLVMCAFNLDFEVILYTVYDN